MAEIGIIGFEKGINEKLEIQNIDEGVKTMFSYSQYFLLWAVINSTWYYWTKFRKDSIFFHASLFVFHLFNFILSGIFYFNKNKMENLETIFKDTMLFPLSYSKFMNFLITDNFIDELDENNNSLLKYSFVVTCFSLIYDFIIFFISEIVDCNSDNLILFQFIFGYAYIGYDIIIVIFLLLLICNE